MTTIDIFNKRVKVELKDVVYREFGEDFVKFYDQESGKYFEVVVKECKDKPPKKSDTVTPDQYKKLVKK